MERPKKQDDNTQLKDMDKEPGRKTSDERGERHRKRRSRSKGKSNSRSRSRSNSRGRKRNKSRSRSRDRSRSRSSDRKKDSRSSRSSYSRRKSRSPSPLARPRKKGMWDKAPPGYEGMNVAQVASINPSVLTPLITPTNTLLHSRQARRLYVGNVSHEVSDSDLMEFFNSALVAAKIVPAGTISVVGCQMNYEKNYAFIEFRSPEEASSGMAFDGMTLHGQIMKIRRPKDYAPQSGGGGGGGSAVPPSPTHDGLDSPPPPSWQLEASNLPSHLTVEQVRELFGSLGPLRSLNLLTDPSTGMSKGVAFFEYENEELAESASMFNGMTVGGKTLTVQRIPSSSSSSSSSSSFRQPSLASLPASNALLTATLLGMAYMGSTSPPLPTNYVLLLNMAAAEEVANETAHQEFLDDVKEECSKLGDVKSISISKPESSALIKVYVHFETIDDAQKAHQTLGGRRYNGRTVVSHFVEEPAQ